MTVLTSLFSRASVEYFSISFSFQMEKGLDSLFLSLSLFESIFLLGLLLFDSSFSTDEALITLSVSFSPKTNGVATVTVLSLFSLK